MVDFTTKTKVLLILKTQYYKIIEINKYKIDNNKINNNKIDKYKYLSILKKVANITI